MPAFCAARRPNRRCGATLHFERADSLEQVQREHGPTFLRAPCFPGDSPAVSEKRSDAETPFPV